MSTVTTNQSILSQIVSSVSGTDLQTVEALVEATNPIKGCRFVSLKNYNSDKSNNTELADHVINIGFQYESMKRTDRELILGVNIQNIDIDSYNYNHVDTGVKTLEEYKREVRANLSLAFTELTQSVLAGNSQRENNDIYLNKVLVFNTKTMCLSIIGQSITKKVTLEGEIKRTKKAALTVAKELIKKAANLRTNTYRRFKVENLNSCKISGETIEIN